MLPNSSMNMLFKFQGILISKLLGLSTWCTGRKIRLEEKTLVSSETQIQFQNNLCVYIEGLNSTQIITLVTVTIFMYLYWWQRLVLRLFVLHVVLFFEAGTLASHHDYRHIPLSSEAAGGKLASKLNVETAGGNHITVFFVISISH